MTLADVGCNQGEGTAQWRQWTSSSHCTLLSPSRHPQSPPQCWEDQSSGQCGLSLFSRAPACPNDFSQLVVPPASPCPPPPALSTGSTGSCKATGMAVILGKGRGPQGLVLAEEMRPDGRAASQLWAGGEGTRGAAGSPRKSRAAAGRGCGQCVWYKCEPAQHCCSAHPIMGAPCTEQGALSHCLIVTLLSCCAVLTGFFLPPEMPHLYKSLIPLWSQCTWEADREIFMGCFPCRGRVCDPGLTLAPFSSALLDITQ